MRTKLLTMRTIWMFILSLASMNCAISQNKRVEIPTPIIEQIINYPQLERFLHPDISGRVPLVISTQFVDPNLSLRKFGKPVRVVRAQNLNAVPHLQFVNFETTGNIAKVSVKYRVEGITGIFTFSRLKNSRWKLLKAEVWES